MKPRAHSGFRDMVIIIALSLLSSVVLYLPFMFHVSPPGLKLRAPDMHTVYQNYDGPLYIVPAKTWYDPKEIAKIPLAVSLPATYFAAHFPLYPALIRMLSFMSYLKAMMAVTLLSTAALAVAFYLLVKRLNLSQHPVWLTAVFLFLPRFLVVRSVGAPESLFMLLIVLSLYFFETERYWLAGLTGGLSAMTKAPGVLLLIAYKLALSERWIKTKKFRWAWVGIGLIPLGLLSVFYLYAVKYHDFFAFWHTGGVVPLVYPFAAFNYQAKWVGTAWLEDIVAYFALYAVTVSRLWDSKYRGLFYFSVTFLLATSFVEHRDIARYALPLWPMACIALEKHLTDKKVLIALAFVLPAIYLYAWGFISMNTLPVSDWSAFM